VLYVITFIRYVSGITFIRYVSGITFIRYAQSGKVGNSDNFCAAKKPKGLNRIPKLTTLAYDPRLLCSC
jgi:hypothetical protein